MLIIPAIDLKDGQCVRLRQGEMDDSTVFSDDPVATAQRWVERRLPPPAPGRSERRLCRASRSTEMRCTPSPRAFPTCRSRSAVVSAISATIERYLEAGVRYVIIGTQAVREPPSSPRPAAPFRSHHRRPRCPRWARRHRRLGRGVGAAGHGPGATLCRRRCQRHRVHGYRARRHAAGRERRGHPGYRPGR
jgi:hypothetical protein